MKGSAMVAACIVIVIGTSIVGGFIAYISHESKIIRMANDSVKLLYVAEAGLERKIYEIGNGDYTNISNTSYPEDTESYYNVMVEQDGNVYTITSTGEISTGLYTQERRLKRIVRQRASIFNLWDLAVFSGGATAGQITGNTQIRGTAFVLGEESFIDKNGDSLYTQGIDEDENNNGIREHLNSSDYGINGTGTFYIGNDYEPFGGNNPPPAEFLSRITSPQTLDGGVFVKYGRIGLLSASAQIGNAGAPMDLVNVPDGFDPLDPTGRVFVEDGGLFYDRGMFNEKIRFPSLDDVVGSVGSPTRIQNFQNNALVLTPGVDIPATITPETVIPTITLGLNSFGMDGSGNMTISGKIFINGPLTINRASGSNDTILYNGNASILTNGDLTINANLYTQEGPNTYPQNLIGFMTPNNINLGTGPGVPLLSVMAIFYAEGTIATIKNTRVAGTFVSNHLDMSTRVPEVFQVKNIKDNLPDGMINIPPVVAVYGWEEVF